MPKDKPNRYNRHQNKKALEKKDRAKFKQQEGRETTVDPWAEFERVEKLDEENFGIVSGLRNQLFDVYSSGTTVKCRLSRNMPRELNREVKIGELVYFEQKDEEHGTITSRLPRRSVLSRLRGDRQRISRAAMEQQITAVNVDKAVIVVAKANPAFHPRFVDRYMVLCENGGIEPVICLNKSDLDVPTPEVLEYYNSNGIEVIETSTITQDGLDKLKASIRGLVSILVGNSGVGKSTLVKNLIPNLNIATSAVSIKTGKGRHTTTTSNLFEWESGSFIIDTPGIRSLSVADIDRSDLQYAFREFNKFRKYCKYNNCLHDKEDSCCVKKAVENGEIPNFRYESYLRMLNE